MTDELDPQTQQHIDDSADVAADTDAVTCNDTDVDDANEWGKDGINVNIVCPLAWTAALENFQDAYPEAFKANVHMPPAGHYGDVEREIGRVVVQLCGPDFKYMNGETVTLEGGMGQRP